MTKIFTKYHDNPPVFNLSITVKTLLEFNPRKHENLKCLTNGLQIQSIHQNWQAFPCASDVLPRYGQPTRNIHTWQEIYTFLVPGANLNNTVKLVNWDHAHRFLHTWKIWQQNYDIWHQVDNIEALWLSYCFHVLYKQSYDCLLPWNFRARKYTAQNTCFVPSITPELWCFPLRSFRMILQIFTQQRWVKSLLHRVSFFSCLLYMQRAGQSLGDGNELPADLPFSLG